MNSLLLVALLLSQDSAKTKVVVTEDSTGKSVNVGDFTNKAIRVNVVQQPAGGATTTATQGAAGTIGGSWFFEQTDGTNLLGVLAHPVRVDVTGTTTQPVSGSVSVSNFPATQPVSGTVTANQGTANTAANAWPYKVTDGTNTAAVKAASTAAAATDPALVVAVSPNNSVAVTGTFFQATQPVSGTVAATESGTWTVQPGNTANTTAWLVAGGKTNNAAAPGATNFGELPALANAAPPSWTEGNQVLHSVDLGGNLRVTEHPQSVLGCYRIGLATSQYTALAAGSAIIALRWGDATHLMVITHLALYVLTVTAATVAGTIDRKLVVARSFTVADTGGTAVVLTTNNNKARTSHATSLVSDFRVTSGSALSAGTRTLDANGYGLAASFLPVSTTGLTIPPTDLIDARAGKDYPLVLATSEGFEVQIPTAMPTSAVNQTYMQMDWCEVNAF